MKKTLILVMGLTILSKIIGLGREIVLSYFYGASSISDAYIISTTIPNFLFGFFLLAFITVFIPIYNGIESDEGKLESIRYTSNFTNVFLLLTTIVFFIALIFINPLVKLFASGFNEETLNIAVKFSSITLFSLFFTALVFVFTAFLQIKKSYILPNLIGIPFSAILIFAIYLSSKGNIYWMAIGVVIAAVAQFLLLLPEVLKKGFKHNCIIRLKDKHIKNTAIIAFPIIISNIVIQINVLVSKSIATNVVGGVSSLNYAYMINTMLQGIFLNSVIFIAYPLISKAAADGDENRLKTMLGKAIGATNLFLIPASVGLLIFAKPIVILLFGRGAFDMQAAEITAQALYYYAFGIAAFGIGDVVSKTFYSLQDTRTPMVCYGIGVVLNIILNFVFAQYMGIGGLALAYSVAAIFSTVLLIYRLRKKIGTFRGKLITISTLKIVGASLVMAIAAKSVFLLVSNGWGKNISLFLAVAVGVMVYGVMVLVMKIEGAELVVQSIRSKFKR